MEIQTAAHRSASLTRQLLAFARKQIIAPKNLDLNETIEEMLKLLRRLIGEDIDLVWRPGKDLWRTFIDPGQIDQILANLLVNARDAISGVGKITIEADNKLFDAAYCREHMYFCEGEYVMLAVTDNGCGMNKETVSHIFEPFYTTKEEGKGTGLGLATVYGIVKQNQGFINVYSEPDKGTTFKLYFPGHQAASVADEGEKAVAPPRGGTETVLLVEDEAPLLELTKKMLEKLGYNVLSANTPGEAIRLAEEYKGDIHLLVTDVVMPEMGGRDLSEKLPSIRPNLKNTLYMSGYTANAIAHQGVLGEGMVFLQKPFSAMELDAHVRKALAAK